MKSKFFNLSGTNGFNLLELVMAMAVGAIVSMAAASIFVLALGQFQLIIDRNDAEQSLLEAVYYLNVFLAQAAKISCQNGPLGNPALVASPANIPVNVDQGVFDCTRFEAPASYWAAGNQSQILAAFVMESGGGAPAPSANSKYVSTVISFKPPTIGPPGRSGVLYFMQGPVTPNTLVTGPSGIAINHLVAVYLVPSAPNALNPATVPPGGAPGTNLELVKIHVVARYFLSGNSVRDYRPYDPAPGTPGVVRVAGAGLPPPGLAYKDIDLVAAINFRDNVLMQQSQTDTNLLTTTAQRSSGQMYYYRFIAPPLGFF